MAKVGSFTHRVKKGALTTFTTNYSGDKYVKVELHDVEDNARLTTGKNFGGSLQLIRISGIEIGGKVNTISIQGYADVDGEQLIIEPTTAVAVDALTHAATDRVSAVFLVDAYINLAVDSLYLFAISGNHSLACDEVFVTWVE